jgi:hypothetical protein
VPISHALIVLNRVWTDGEEFGGLGALILDHGRVPEMLIERRLLALIAGKAIGHQMRSGGHIGFQEGAQFGGAGSTAIRALPA